VNFKLHHDIFLKIVILRGGHVRKIRVILLVQLGSMLMGATSFGETYFGKGDKTEFGAKSCGMTVQNMGKATLVLIRPHHRLHFI